MERRRYRRTLTGAARGERHQPDTLSDTLSNSTQGLGAAAAFCGVLAALFVWLESLAWYPLFATLAAVTGGTGPGPYDTPCQRRRFKEDSQAG